MTQNIRSKQYWKYKIIEYDYISMHYEGGEKKIEICKSPHKTNSWLFMMIIIICFKIQGIKYDVIKGD